MDGYFVQASESGLGAGFRICSARFRREAYNNNVNSRIEFVKKLL